MLDIIIVLTAPAVMACYYYGLRAFALIALSAAVSVLCELIGCKLFGLTPCISDLSSLATGIAVALCLLVALEVKVEIDLKGWNC